MANVVIAEPPPSMPEPETRMVATVATESSAPTSVADDLTSLRRRLERAPFELPAVRFTPSPRGEKPGSLLRRDF
jgi:hypothetical protein